MLRYTTLLLALAAMPAAAGDAVTFTSGERQVALVELYTSEGCSSCPPAERWLNGLESRDGLWSSFVPVAFHVDYWDYIGWKDRFAQSAFARRQRDYVSHGRARAVYTPGVFAAGEEWLDWRKDRLPAASADRPGSLSVRVDGTGASASFTAKTALRDPRIHIAILAFDQRSAVGAGENRGRQLQHDFVVESLSVATLEATPDGYRAVVPLPDGGDARKALAAWVSANGDPTPIQATGGFIAGRGDFANGLAAREDPPANN